MQDCSGTNIDAGDIIVLHDMLPSEIGSPEVIPEPYIVVSEIEQPVDITEAEAKAKTTGGSTMALRVDPRGGSSDSDSDDTGIGPDAEDLDIMEAFKKDNCSPAIKRAMIDVIDARRKESAARKRTTAALEHLASLVFEGTATVVAESA